MLGIPVAAGRVYAMVMSAGELEDLGWGGAQVRTSDVVFSGRSASLGPTLAMDYAIWFGSLPGIAVAALTAYVDQRGPVDQERPLHTRDQSLGVGAEAVIIGAADAVTIRAALREPVREPMTGDLGLHEAHQASRGRWG